MDTNIVAQQRQGDAERRQGDAERRQGRATVVMGTQIFEADAASLCELADLYGYGHEIEEEDVPFNAQHFMDEVRRLGEIAQQNFEQQQRQQQLQQLMQLDEQENINTSKL
jgi:hypothetical protein